MIRISQSSEVGLFALEGEHGLLREVSPAFADLLGLTSALLDGRPLLELVHPDDMGEAVAALSALEGGVSEVLVENRFVPRDGGGVYLQWVARPQGGSGLACAAARDETQLARAVAERADLRQRLAVALGPPVVALWTLDVRSGRLQWEPGAAQVLGTGVRRLPVTIDALAATLVPADAPVLVGAFEQLVATGTSEARVRVEQGEGTRLLALRGRVVTTDVRSRPRRAAGLLLDVTAARAVEEQMVRMSSSGMLDGIPNRRAFDQALAAEWRRCTRGFEPLSVIIIDMDDFAALNSRYGHRIGDEALGVVARTLTRSLHRAGDLVARFGGQEFAVVLPGIDEAGALAVGQRLVEAVRAVRLDEAAEWSFSVSVGTASWLPGSDTASVEELLGQAGRALYGAKGAGKDRVVLTLPDTLASQPGPESGPDGAESEPPTADD